MDSTLIPITDIDENPDNRAAGGLGDIAALAASIDGVGQLVPAIVAATGNGRYRMLDGHRRLAALRSLGTDRSLSAIVVASTNEGIELMSGLAANELREDLTDADRARAFQMVLMDIPPGEVSAATGIERGAAEHVRRIARRIKPECVSDFESLSRVAEYELVDGASEIIDTWEGTTAELIEALAEHVRHQGLRDYAAEHFPGIPVVIADSSGTAGWKSWIAGRALTKDKPCGCDGFRVVYGNHRWQAKEGPQFYCSTPENHAKEIEAFEADRKATSTAEQQEREAKEAAKREAREAITRTSPARIAWLWEIISEQNQKDMGLWHDLSITVALTCPLDQDITDVMVRLNLGEEFATLETKTKRALFAVLGAAYVEATLDGYWGPDIARWQPFNLDALLEYLGALDDYNVPTEIALPFTVEQVKEALDGKG